MTMAHLAWETLHELADAAAADVAAAGAPRTAAELHLAECPRCRDALGALRAVDAAARALPTAVEPPEALWTSVSASIGARRRQPPAPRGAPRRAMIVEARWLAAAALVLMTLTAAATAWWVRRDGEARLAAGGSAAAAIPATFAATERAYLDDVAELQGLLDAQRPRLAPSTIAVVERALGTIDAAIAEARAAFIADPANLALAELLGATYRQKVELLRRAAEVPNAT